MPKKTEPLPWAAHILTAEGKSGFSCSVCGQAWKKEPVSKCPGLPVYKWEAAPAGLKTVTQLREQKMKPGGPVRGLLPYSKSDDGYVRLYLESEAVAMKPRTEAQIAATAKAQETRIKNLTCARCGLVMPSKRLIFLDICYDCHEVELIKDRQEADSAEVITEAAELVQQDFIVVDTETTSLHGLPVSICIIDRAGTVLLDTLVNPGENISEGARAVHGISAEMVADAPTFTDLYPTLRALLHGKKWVGYNIGFDIGVLDRACEKAGLEAFKVSKRWDVMSLSAVLWSEWSDYWGDYKWIKLDEAAYCAGVSVEDKAHSALGDCRRTLGVLKAIAAMEREAAAT